MRTIAKVSLGLCILGCSTEDSVPLLDAMASNNPGDYQPLNASELTLTSDVIVRGHIRAVREGRVAEYTLGDSEPIPMLVVEVEVTETVKGEPNGSAYFEYFRGADSPGDLRLPAEEVMLFLWPPGWASDRYEFDFPSRGVPDGQSLWMLRSPQGLLLQADGVAIQPLATPDDVQVFERKQLVEVQEEVEALLASPRG